jgi:FAD:protein FMN transferase
MSARDPAAARARRRFLKVSAAAAALAALPARAGAAGAQMFARAGVLLGADAEIRLYHRDARAAEAAIDACFAEAARLESVFSLHRADSALSRLNRNGQLDDPPPELVELLRAAIAFGHATGGAFDVTVQPLWDLYAGHFAGREAAADGPAAADVARARDLVDYRRIEVDAGRIAFARRGMAVTLNGIAQGYITDRISALLRARGFDNVLVNLGEFRALGGHADGAPWRVAVPDPVQPWRRLRTLALADAALATSGGYGTQFDAAGRHHHLFDPRDGRSAGFYRSVSVLAPDATTADALSTGLSILEPDAARRALAAFPRAGAIFVGRDRTNWSAGALPKA